MYECNTGNSRMNEILNRRVIETCWLGWGVMGTEVEPVGDVMGGWGIRARWASVVGSLLRQSRQVQERLELLLELMWGGAVCQNIALNFGT